MFIGGNMGMIIPIVLIVGLMVLAKPYTAIPPM